MPLSALLTDAQLPSLLQLKKIPPRPRHPPVGSDSDKGLAQQRAVMLSHGRF